MHSDVLIVGAGSAGSVLAERLSADPARQVRVLEGGPAANAGPVAAAIDDGLRLPLAPGSPVVARYPALLTEHPPRPVELVRGAVTGGSGAVNGGYFCRGPAGDFADWALPGWGPSEVLDHFRAIETDLDRTGPLHGDAGPIRVRRAADPVGVSAAFAEAALGAGVRWLDDLNGDHERLPDGVGAVVSNIVDGHRVGPGRAFLSRSRGRPNLFLHNGLRVNQLDFSGTRVTGVTAEGPRGPVRFSADAVVLSAGAIGTATLLLRSGIGDPEHLGEHGISVRVPAPVGATFCDHPEWILPTDAVGGPLRPVLEVVLSLGYGIEMRPYTSGFAAMAGVAGDPDPLCIGVALMTPSARGTLRLRAADPLLAPDIRHRYDTAPTDIARLTEGVAQLREIIGGTMELGDPQWSTSQHLCSTAPMGADGDPRAVLDPQCRVRGVEGLWVIDGSSLPKAPSRGPHATTVMLAHRAAEFVG